jgi:hypothetical protein
MNNKQSDLNQNKRLQRELERKKKALAEAAVLLTLKKGTSICLRTKRSKQQERSAGDSQVYSRGKKRGRKRTHHLSVSGDHSPKYPELAETWSC